MGDGKIAKTRHPPAPGTLLKEGFRVSPTKKSLCFSVLLVLSSCSFKEPGQQDDQDRENKLLDSGEMKVCISGLTLTQTPNPQKNKSCLKGLGFRVRVSPEKQTLDFGKSRGGNPLSPFDLHLRPGEIRRPPKGPKRV